MNNIKKIPSPYGLINLHVHKYLNNSRLAILSSINDELFDDVTINLPDFQGIKENEAFLNHNVNGNDGNDFNLVHELKQLGVIESTYGTYQYNYGNYELVKFNMEKLREYDPEGIEGILMEKKNLAEKECSLEI